jgi:hypothetical protein
MLYHLQLLVHLDMVVEPWQRLMPEKADEAETWKLLLHQNMMGLYHNMFSPLQALAHLQLRMNCPQALLLT